MIAHLPRKGPKRAGRMSTPEVRTKRPKRPKRPKYSAKDLPMMERLLEEARSEARRANETIATIRASELLHSLASALDEAWQKLDTESEDDRQRRDEIIKEVEMITFYRFTTRSTHTEYVQR